MAKNQLRPAMSAFLLMLTMSLLSTALSFFVALACLAFGSGSIGTLMPVVVRRIFGGRDYAAIWSVVISCSSVASFIAAPGVGYGFRLLRQLSARADGHAGAAGCGHLLPVRCLPEHCGLSVHSFFPLQISLLRVK